MLSREEEAAYQREYYLRNKERLAKKRRSKSGGDSPSSRSSSPPPKTTSPKAPPKQTTSSTEKVAKEKARVSRLEGKVKTLEGALSKALAALSEKRQAATKSEKESSDGKSSAEEKKASKEYRERNKAKIAEKERKEDSKDGSSKDSSDEASKEASVEDLEARVTKIKSALASAKKQLSEAKKNLGQLAHSAFMSDPKLNDRFCSIPVSRKDSVKMAVNQADFSGYATRNDLRCSDGRTILANAFADNDGAIVPLVWQHGHEDAENVLGHVKLENRSDGVYAHAFFNKTPKGQHAKEMVRHGDVKFLSIFANQLTERVRDRVANLKDVVKGNIREVSLVLAGANPGAYIDNVNIVHGDGEIWTEEAVITTGLEIDMGQEEDHSLEHAEEDDDERTLKDILETLNEEQEVAVNYLLSQALTVGGDVKHSDTDSDYADAEDEDDEESESVEGEDQVDDDSETDEADEAVQHDNTNQEDNSMTHNVFDQAKRGGTVQHEQVHLSHDDVKAIVSTAMKHGSLKDAVESYVTEHGVMVGGALQHGIENIDYLFPDAKTLENSPAFISRRMEWVDKVLSSVRKSPFSRIKTITADITPDEARARGYIKGNMKNEEFFALSKRETTPQTIYKKQKLDRDDVIDIVDLDVVAWLKAEMKVMLDEELAGAILVGDGRSIGDDDKIKESNIRPIATDAELYVTTVNVNLGDASSSIEELVDAVIDNRKYYKGTGQPTFYTTEGVISKFLTVKDSFGRRIYSNLQEVASVLRVSDIVPVEVMERDADLVGIMVNLADYTLGADRNGQATMFDDFDIDYNKLRYLIETRVSGALTQPKAALVFRSTDAANVLVTPTAPSFDGTDVTVPTVTGVVYKDGDGSTLTTASPVTLADGEELHVVATPDTGYYFANNAEDEWDFVGQA